MLKKVLVIIISVLLLAVILKAAVKAVKLSPFFFQLLFSKDINLKKTNDNVNILLLGIGGGTHDGPNLTDTIILASINVKNNKTILISIPRDLWVPDLKSRINEAYADGESKKRGGGLIEAEAAVQKITGQNIDYGIRVDFSGFVKAIDILGGIEVNVQNSFDDYQYPIFGREADPCGKSPEELQGLATISAELQVSELFCRHKHVHFDKGIRHMNGETVLEFVRSRHAQGAEGSDFARSKRQELIIQALKNKVLSLNVLFNPSKIIGLYDALQASIDTNIKEDEFDDFIRLFQKMSRERDPASAGKNLIIQSAVLDYGDDQTGKAGLLFNPPLSAEFDYAWILIPRIGNGNFSEIQKYVGCEVKIGNCPISKIPRN